MLSVSIQNRTKNYKLYKHGVSFAIYAPILVGSFSNRPPLWITIYIIRGKRKIW